METKKSGVQAEAHTKEQTSGGHAHSHTHVLEDGTVVTHTHTHSHEHTKAVINRLSRAIGHLESIKKMVENGRDCSEVLIQLSAVKSAINNTGKIILQDHRKSHSSGPYPALSGRCDRVRRQEGNRRIK